MDYQKYPVNRDNLLSGTKVAHTIKALCSGGQYHVNMTQREYYCYIQNIVRRLIPINMKKMERQSEIADMPKFTTNNLENSQTLVSG